MPAALDPLAHAFERAEIGHAHELFLYSIRDFGFITGAEAASRAARGPYFAEREIASSPFF
jgi:hypothetical protein